MAVTRPCAPTLGWIRFSAARLAAQRTLAALLDHVMPDRPERTAREKSGHINRHTGKPHQHQREMARRQRQLQRLNR